MPNIAEVLGEVLHVTNINNVSIATFNETMTLKAHELGLNWSFEYRESRDFGVSRLQIRMQIIATCEEEKLLKLVRDYTYQVSGLAHLNLGESVSHAIEALFEEMLIEIKIKENQIKDRDLEPTENDGNIIGITPVTDLTIEQLSAMSWQDLVRMRIRRSERV
jgi:hypothetical protein